MSSPTPAPAPSKSRVFASRLFSTLLLWGVMMLVFLWENPWVPLAVTAFFGAAGSFEYYRLLREDKSAKSFHILGICIGLGYWAGTIWSVMKFGEPPMWLDLAALTASVHGSFILCYRQRLEGMMTLQRIFSTVFGVVYTVMLFGFMAKLMYFRATGPEVTGLYLVLFLVMITKFSDMGAYAFGVVFGKHKMIPHISPAKSWEGLAGAYITSLAGAVILLLWIPEKLAPLNWTHGMILTPILCTAGIAGDLAESVLKRCTAIKDSGHTLPGIGGILDLTDSLLFTAPLFYFYLAVITA